jgi:Holliday junction resolvasome RuvABC endonuclease subunit
MPKIVALDLGTKTGYAYTFDGKVHIGMSGVADFTPSRHEGGGMRMMRFSKWLEELLEGDDVILLYEEVASHKGTAAAHIYGGFLGILQTHCENNKIPYRGFPVGSIKKHATGRGNANKNDMIAHASRKFGRVESHDQADALWILSLGLTELGD